jgi:VWFA-related protein
MVAAMVQVCLMAGGALLAAAVQSPSDEQRTFRASTRAVAVYATVQDETGRLVTELTAADFRLSVDGQPVPITTFSREATRLGVAFMIDTSEVNGHTFGSHFAEDRARLGDAILAFVDALGEDDTVSLGTFGLQIAVGATRTRDRTEIERVLLEEIWIGGGSPVWQAMTAALVSLTNEPRRKAVVVLTNGIDTGRLPGFSGRRGDVAEYADRLDAALYAIRVGPRQSARPMTPELKKLTVATGGGFVEVDVSPELDGVFRQVANELRHQYLIGFPYPEADGLEHTVELSTARPGLKVRFKDTFLAAGDTQ